MIEVLDNSPDWANYNESSVNTREIMKYFDD